MEIRDHTTPHNAPPKMSRRFQFSLRALLVVSFAVCLSLGRWHLLKTFGQEVDADPKQDELQSRPFQSVVFGTSEEKLVEVQCDSNAGVAIGAAWARVQRTVPVEEQPRPVHPDAEAISRFLGFVEGKLPAPIPKFWEQGVRKASARKRSFIGFEFVPKREAGQIVYKPVRGDLWAPEGITIEARGLPLYVSNGDVTARLTTDIFTSKWTIPGPRISIAFAGCKYFLAHHSSNCWPYYLHRVDASTGQIEWSTEVRAAGGTWDYTGPPGSHSVAIACTDEIVVVFGLDFDAAYIEGFERATGKNLYRFSTAVP
jgi:hypothetical protein